METSTIHARISDLVGLYATHKLVPANVQRAFEWRTAQTSTLINDLLGESSKPASSSPYFLGSFVLKPLSSGGMEIFDGLQRLVTLTILFAVLRDLLSTQDPQLSDTLNTMVEADTGFPRVQLGGSDPTLAALIQRRGEASKIRRIPDEDTLRGRLLSAARLFRSVLSNQSTNALANFADFLICKTVCNIVLVEDESLARQIFITTNNRGLSLSEPDILRSQIHAIPLRSDVAETVLQDWQSIEADFAASGDYQAFLQTLDFVTRRQMRGPRGLTDLGDHLASQLDDEGILGWVKDARVFGEAWRWLQAVRADPKRHDPFQGAVFRCFLFENTEWMPLGIVLSRKLLDALAQKDRRAGRHLAGRFSALARFMACHTALGTNSIELSERMAAALVDERAGRNPFTHSLQISDADRLLVQATLDEPIYNRTLIRAILSWLQSNSNRTPDVEMLASIAEPVLPSTPIDGETWSLDFPEAMYRTVDAHRLGNFVLRTTPNETIEPNFKSVRRGVPDYRVNRDVRRAKSWTKSAIVARSDALRNEFLETVFPGDQ